MSDKPTLSPRLLSRLLVRVIITCLVLNSPLLAWGNPVPGRWEKVAETRVGENMVIHTKSGDQYNFSFLSIDEKYLICSSKDDGTIQIDLLTIDSLVIPKSAQYAKKGALLGAAGGVGAFLGIVASYSGPSMELGYGAAALIGGVLGAGAGYAVGAAVGAPGETVYISKEAALAEAR